MLIRYRCFHVLPDNKYAVKASDYVRDPLVPEDLQSQERYFLESLFDGGLEMLVASACDSLEEAITPYDVTDLPAAAHRSETATRLSE